MNLKLKSLLNKLSHDEVVVRFASKMMALIMRFSYFTTKWTIIGQDIPDAYHNNHEPFIVCHWHDRLMVTPCVWRWKEPLHVLASNHRDGQFIARIVENFSMKPVFGSTGKGTVAVRTIIKLIKQNKYIAIIPDGPTGPRHKAALGAGTIAKLTKTAILPYSFCVKRYFCFDSWDKFIFTWPFNRGVMVWGKPITYDEIADMDVEEISVLLENRINEATQKAKDVLYGC